MQDDNAELGSTYRLARAFQPTTDQERRIWATLPGASDDQRQTIIDQALWVALQYGQFVEFRAHHHLPSEAATLRSTLEEVEKVGAKFLDRLRQLDQSQRRLGTGGLALYHALNGPPMACDLSIRQVKTILSEVQSISGTALAEKVRSRERLALALVGQAFDLFVGADDGRESYPLPRQCWGVPVHPGGGGCGTPRHH